MNYSIVCKISNIISLIFLTCLNLIYSNKYIIKYKNIKYKFIK